MQKLLHSRWSSVARVKAMPRDHAKKGDAKSKGKSKDAKGQIRKKVPSSPVTKQKKEKSVGIAECDGRKAQSHSSATAASKYGLDSWKKRSDGLVKKLSNLRIGGSYRISPLPQFSSHRVRYLSTFTVNSLEQIAELISVGKCKNIIVMAGAGISTPSGIPDFRTPGSGLYDNLEQYKLPEPTAVFDIFYFINNPKPFFQLAKELYPGNYNPNYVHYFLRALYEKGLLLRLYTQNIDALERLAGIPDDKLIEAHGSFYSATCMSCKMKYSEKEIKIQVMNDQIPYCRRNGCKGVVKPDIVFFGEDLPRRFFKYRMDFPRCDLLIVLGTSLEVEPFASLVYEVQRSTPRLLINRDAVSVFRKSKKRGNDVIAKGDIVEQVRRFVDLLEWTEYVDSLMPKNEKPYA